MKRHYSVLFFRPGGYMNWPSSEFSSSYRIHAVAVMLFRKWFGRDPNFHFGFDGWFGMARDERGNEIHIDQNNHVLTNQWHTPDPRLFALFTLDGAKLTPYIPTSHQLGWPEKEAA